MAGKKTSFYDSLFGLDEVTVQNAKEKGIPIQDIDPTKLHEFKNHPFKVLQNEDFESLKESIRKFGILEPVVARESKDGYEIISGHRRTMVAKSLGLKTVPVLLIDLDDDLAKIMVVDANKYRKKFDPSELAFAFKMRYEAEKHRGRVGISSNTTAEIIGKDYGQSQRNVYNYMKLTQLKSELLRYVDEKKFKCSAAMEIADLSEDMQDLILQEYNDNGRFPNLAEARQIKFQETFDKEWLHDLMCKEEPKKKVKHSLSEFDRYFPEDYSDEEKMEKIDELLNRWHQEQTQRAL